MIKYLKIVSVFLLMLTLTGCGYTAEEKQTMEKYEKQGETNAVNYIKEKYGFEATVTNVACKKYNDGFDFSPSPTGNVYVTFDKDGNTFMVEIPGDKVTTAGFDNYQLPEIKAALEQTLQDISGLPAEELFLCNGTYKGEASVESDKNGLINGYFDGNNLSEVLADTNAAVVVSYINQDVSGIDAEAVKEQTGIEHYLFVDYSSREDYATIDYPYYNIAGTPIDWTIDRKVLYINAYRLVEPKEDTYSSCYKKVINDIVFITENPEEEISITEVTLDDVENWNGRGFINAKQIFDAYQIHTNSRKVHVYIPIDQLETSDTEDTRIVEQFIRDGEKIYTHPVTRTTDDNKYLYGIFYIKDYTDYCFSVLKDQE